jgi:hypothetical protein
MSYGSRMHLFIKLNLQFDGNLVFSEFLPEAESDALTLTVVEGKYQVRVFISDRGKQIRGGPELPTDLRQNLSLHCAGLTMEVEALSPVAEIVHIQRCTTQLRNRGALATG